MNGTKTNRDRNRSKSHATRIVLCACTTTCSLEQHPSWYRVLRRRYNNLGVVVLLFEYVSVLTTTCPPRALLTVFRLLPVISVSILKYSIFLFLRSIRSHQIKKRTRILSFLSRHPSLFGWRIVLLSRNTQLSLSLSISFSLSLSLSLSYRGVPVLPVWYCFSSSYVGAWRA